MRVAPSDKAGCVLRGAYTSGLTLANLPRHRNDYRQRKAPIPCGTGADFLFWVYSYVLAIVKSGSNLISSGARIKSEERNAPHDTITMGRC